MRQRRSTTRGPSRRRGRPLCPKGPCIRPVPYAMPPPPPRPQGCIRKERPQRRLGRRLEEVAKAVGGGYCPLQMPLRLALGVRGAVAGHRLGALEGGGGSLPPFQCIPATTSSPPPQVLHFVPIGYNMRLLEAMLYELYDAVDYFVLYESSRTQIGVKKAAFFDIIRHRLPQFDDKIIYLFDDVRPKEAEVC